MDNNSRIGGSQGVNEQSNNANQPDHSQHHPEFLEKLLNLLDDKEVSSTDNVAVSEYQPPYMSNIAGPKFDKNMFDLNDADFSFVNDAVNTAFDYSGDN